MMEAVATIERMRCCWIYECEVEEDTPEYNNNNNCIFFIATTHGWAYLDALHNKIYRALGRPNGGH